jgi:hypothetical protein
MPILAAHCGHGLPITTVGSKDLKYMSFLQIALWVHATRAHICSRFMSRCAHVLLGISGTITVNRTHVPESFLVVALVLALFASSYLGGCISFDSWYLP